MRWAWLLRHPGAPVPVSGEQRDELDAARRLLADKQAALAARVPHIDRVTAFLERERRRNHFGERVRVAFGLGDDETNGGKL